MINIYKKSIRDRKLKKYQKLVPGSWVYVVNPSPRETKKLTSFGLEVSLLRDALDPYEVPRIETENGNTYIYTRFAERENDKVVTSPLGIVISEDFLGTISAKQLPFIEKFTQETIDFYTTQKTKLFIQIFIEINASYSTFLNNVNKEVRKIMVEPGKVSNNDIVKLVQFEEILNTMLADLTPMGSILNVLLSGKILRLYEQDRDLVEDIVLSIKQLIKLAKLNLKTIVNIREAYSTIVTNNLNQVMKVLTVATVILTIPTIIASLFGMNVTLPMSQHPSAFWFVIGFITLISMLLVFIFIKNRWL